MKACATALVLFLAALPAPAGASGPTTDTGAPDFAAIERLLEDESLEARRRVVEAIGAMDAYVQKVPPRADELVLLGRAYLRAMGQGGSFRAGQLVTQALRMDAKHGPAHLLLAELAAYAQCVPCAQQSLAEARAAGVDEASLAAMEGLAFWMLAHSDPKNRAVGEKPPLDRAIEAYERAARLEKSPVRRARYRAYLFELERAQGNHARALEYGEALLAEGDPSETFAGKYATFLLYERGDVERAAPLAAAAATDQSNPMFAETFAMVLYRLWADAYLANPKDPGNRVKLDAAKGANPDLGAVFAKAVGSTATLAVADALLKAGLVKADDPGMRDVFGNTPLANAIAGARADHAVVAGEDPYGEPLNDEQFAVVRTLLEQGANPNAYIAGRNQTVLGHAAARGDIRVVNLLLEKGANVHARVGERASPLAEAAESRHLERADQIASILLAKNVPVTARNSRGETALHAAARKGNAKLIDRLLKAGADPMAKDNSGWRPLELATSYGHVDAVKRLLAGGAQVVVVKNACGSTNALDIARRMQNPELIRLLEPYVREGI